ncbi:MAG: potassium transporter KefB [Alphaproteobacteria bacterium]|nr:MAG: potassium transporter KefB [Alphaproteobacteria bacterium]
MPHDTSLIDILTLMAVAIGAATLFSRLGLGAILGYLVAGAVIGPWGLKLVTNPESIAHLGEFGVVFLLFLIGIELKPSRLWVMRKQVFGLGSLQLVLTGLVLTGLAHMGLGLATGPAIVAGFGLALSSTAFGLQLMAAKGQLATQWGRASFSILLLQDLAVVPLLALVAALGEGQFTLSASVGLAFLETLAVVAGALIAGRFLINPLFRMVATVKIPEIFTGTALLLVLGFGWLMEAAGLSMAMGAFMAGILLADSEYRHQVEIDIQPFRGLLLGLFFMSVGMGINIGALASQTGLILGMLALLLLIKAAVIISVLRVGGLGLPEGIRAGLLLAQAGEFGFVLFAVAVAEGVLPTALSEALVSVIALSMAVTPLMVMASDFLAGRMAPVPKRADSTVDTREECPSRVLVAGFGRVGETVAHMLKALDVPFTAIDLDPVNVERAKALGFDAYYGDASRADILKAVGAGSACLLVLTMASPKAVERTLVAARRQFPHMAVHARAHDIKGANSLMAAGAAHTVPETLEASLQMAAGAARATGAEAGHVATLLDELRATGYRALGTGATG